MFVTTIMMKQKILRELSAFGRITTKMRKEFFRGCGFKEIRDWLESQGLDRHMAIELDSTEVAIICPKGLVLQIRKTEKNRFGYMKGLFGGVIKDGETPIQGAIRELKEETGLVLRETDLIFVEENVHEHVYDNGDRAIFHAYRFKVVNYIPTIKQQDLDQDTEGIAYVSEVESAGSSTISDFLKAQNILSHQVDFVKRMLDYK